MTTPEGKPTFPVLSEADHERLAQQFAAGQARRLERRQLVATEEYGTWVKDFAARHRFHAESGYGVGEYEGEDTEKVELVLDFIELALNHAEQTGASTLTPGEFSTYEVEIAIDDSVLAARRMHGQGVMYGLSALEDTGATTRPRVDMTELIDAVRS